MKKYGTDGQATDGNKLWRIACRIPVTTGTHSEYVLLSAVPLRKWLHEDASMLGYTYIARFVACVTQYLPSGVELFARHSSKLLLNRP